MKKICFFSGDITRVGGTERVATIIMNELAKKEYEVVVLSLVEQKDRMFFTLSDKIKRYSLGDKWLKPGLAYLPLIPKLHRFVKKQKVDVLIDIDTVLDVLSVPVSKMTGVKVISWEHFNHKFEMTVLYRRLIISIFTKHADYLVTLTHHDMESFCKEFRRTNRIVSIHNPMLIPDKQELDNEHNPSENIQGLSYREEYTERKESGIIVSAVRLVDIKGVEYMLEVAERILPKHPGWKWYVLGDGEKRQFMEQQIREKKFEDSFILKGNVENVNDYLAKADIFVLTSKMEGLPMCLLEAKAYRIPCVSFDIETGPDEIIMDGVNGYLVKPFDCKDMATKLGQLMEDEVLRKSFSEHAWVNQSSFELGDIINKWENLLAEVTHG